MKFFLFLLISMPLISREYQVDFDNGRVPDLALSPDPIPLGQMHAFKPILQVGPKTFRANITYGLEIDEEYFFKTSLEYLSQKLTFDFQSGITHRWVQQGAIGVELGYAPCIEWLEFTSLALIGSHSNSYSFISRLAPESSEVTSRRIAGVDGISARLNTTFIPWCNGSILLNGIYDYLKVDYHFRTHKVLQGFGVGLRLDQTWGKWSGSLGGEIHPDYVFYDFRLTSSYFDFGKTGTMTIFGERVNGFHHLSSSSRIGIEFGFAFGPLRKGEQCPSLLSSNLLTWSNTPAVKMAEVLAGTDQKGVNFEHHTGLAGLIGSVNVPLGSFALDVTPYFSSPTPLIYSATLPSGFSINPVSGIISGVHDGSLSGSYQISITATNYYGSASQVLTLIF